MALDVSKGPVAGRLEGKTAIITGAARGIGRSIALLFAEAGARLVLGDRDEQGLEATGRAIGGPTETVTCDVSASEGAARLVAAARGRLDILVNNAADFVVASLVETRDGDWQATLDATLRSAFVCCRAALPLLVRRGGAIVNIASVNARRGAPNHAAYAAAKGGVVALTLQLAVENGPRGVRSNSLSPGFIATEAAAERLAEGEERLTAEAYPLGRLGAVSDVAYAALFLASDESSFINGVDLAVDGGLQALSPAAVVSPRLRRFWGRPAVARFEER